MVHKNPQRNELGHSNAIRKITLMDERLDNCLQMQQVIIEIFYSKCTREYMAILSLLLGTT